MNVIGNTDFIQVIVLIIGGLVVTYTSLNMVSEHFGGSGLVTLQINFSNINQVIFIILLLLINVNLALHKSFGTNIYDF